MEFNPALQKLQCPFCESVFTMEEVQMLDETANAPEEVPEQGAEEMELSGTSFGADETAGMKVYGCNMCGAEIVVDATTAATKCPYCDNVVVMKGQFTGGLRPDLVIPFKFSKQQAVERFKQHINSQKYVPKVFSANDHPEEIQGVYVPFWLFDADAEADITYNAQRIRSWSDRNYHYTETEYYRVRRAGTLRMERVPVDGSQKMPDELMESIEPFDAKEAVPFTTGYLAGYLANRYDVDHTQCKDRALDRMRTSAESAFRNTVKGYTGVSTVASHVTWAKAKVSYALYPVWMLSTQWNGKVYQFAMNGQTGKFVGDLPLDNKAFNSARIKYGLVFAAVIFVAMTLLTSFA